MDDSLFEADWQYALHTIYRLNKLDDLRTFETKALEYIRLSIPFCQGIFHIFKRDEDDVVTFHSKPVVEGMPALYLDKFCKDFSQDVFFEKTSLAMHSEAIRDTDLMPDELRMKTDWYREIYAKQGIHYALRSRLVYDGLLMGSIDLFRSKDEYDFSDKEMRILNTLSPHITLKLVQLLEIEKNQVEGFLLDRNLASRHGLTARECEVLEMILSTKSDADIATGLCISRSTLKKHIHNAYGKLGVKNRHQLYAALEELRR